MISVPISHTNRPVSVRPYQIYWGETKWLETVTFWRYFWASPQNAASNG